CAVNLKEAIETELSNFFHTPRVFVDNQGVQGGDDWRKRLRKELCHSLVMVPIWTPIYCAPEHHWCGLEWAAMVELERKRLPDEAFGLIVPVIYRELRSRPAIVERLKPIDFSRFPLSSKRVRQINAFKTGVESIRNRIIEVAAGLRQRNAMADCKD